MPSIKPQAHTHQQALRARLISHCAQVIQEQTTVWLNTLLDDTDNALNELAHHSDQQRMRTLCHDAVRELKLQRTNITDQFTTRLHDFLGTLPPAAQQIPQSNGSDDLKLLLALDPIARRADMASRPAMKALHRRFEAIGGQPAPVNWPINAMKLGDIYLQSLAPISADFRIKLALVKLLDAHVYALLPELYRLLEQALSSEQTHLGSITNSSRTAGTPMPQLLQVLNKLQTTHSIPGPQHQNTYSWLCDVLPAALTSERQLLIAANTLDQLYASLSKQHGMYQPLAAEFNLMRVALLKLIVLDRQFVQQPGHAARKLLMAMLQVGPALSEVSEATQHLKAKIHDDIVLRINREFASNPQLFNDILQDFNAFIAKQQHTHLAQQHQHIRQAQANEEIAFARTYIEQELAIRCAGRRLNQDTIRLLRNVWSDVLIAIYLKEGSESPRWALALEITDDLLTCTDEAQDAQHRQQMAALTPQLIDALREDLRDIGWESIKIDGMFTQLTDMLKLPADTQPAANTSSPTSTGEWIYAADTGEWVLATSLSQKTQEVVTNNDDPLTAGNGFVFDLDRGKWRKTERNLNLAKSAPEVDIAPPKQTTTRVNKDIYLDMVHELKINDWIELENSHGEIQRARLAWKSDIAERLIFVNWRQQIIAEPSIAGLAIQLRNGTAKLLNRASMKEKAISSVLQALSGSNED